VEGADIQLGVRRNNQNLRSSGPMHFSFKWRPRWTTTRNPMGLSLATISYPDSLRGLGACGIDFNGNDESWEFPQGEGYGRFPLEMQGLRGWKSHYITSSTSPNNFHGLLLPVRCGPKLDREQNFLTRGWVEVISSIEVGDSIRELSEDPLTRIASRW